MTFLPAFLHIKVAPHQQLHFLGKTHAADNKGILRDVQYDVAKIMIADPAHPAVEASEQDLAPAAEAEADKSAKATPPAKAKPATDTKAKDAE